MTYIDDYYVRRVKLPKDVNELVAPDRDGPGYNIYIDERLDDAHARKAYAHAVGHIAHEDCVGGDVQGIEMRAHG